MNKIIFVLLLIVSTLFLNCKNDNLRSQDIITEKDVAHHKIIIDTTLTKIIDLPIQIDSTSYLIHPVGYVSKRSSYSEYSSTNNKDIGLKVTSGYDDEVSGDITNLLFQNFNSDTLHSLTDLNIKIKSFEFLRAIYSKTKKKLLFYHVIDTDTNKNFKLDFSDLESLYLSNIDGTNFIKITKPNHKVIDTKIIDVNNRLYFKTLEISKLNKKRASFHYFYINFIEKDIKVYEYFPSDKK